MKKILALFALLLYSPVVLFAVPNIVPVKDTAAAGGSGGSVNVNDGSGNPITSTSGALDVNIASGSSSGTEYTEDAAAAANPAGGMLIVRRKDTLSATEVSADGDNIAVNATAKGEVYVKQTDAVPVTDNSSSLTVDNGGTFAVQESGSALTALQLIDDPIAVDDTATHSTGATKVMGIGAVAEPTDTTLNANDIGMPGMSVGRELYGVIRDAAGNLRGANVNASNQLSVSVDNTVTVGSHAVTNAGTFAVQESGSALTALQLIDDGVYTDDTSTHSTGSSKGYGIMAAATPTDTAVNANDLGVVGMTNNRELYVSLRDIAGATAVTGSGTATGALRVELANNGTGLVTANPATAANWGVYVEDAGETAGGNLEMLGTVRRDTAASSAGTSGDNATLNTDANGYVWSRTADPCSAQIPTTVAISQTASTKLISQAASKTNYVCSAVIVAGAAEVVNIIEGTGVTCGTSTAAVAGSTTAANGISLAANGGFTINSPVKGTGTNLDLCLSQSGSNRVSGYITYVQQ